MCGCQQRTRPPEKRLLRTARRAQRKLRMSLADLQKVCLLILPYDKDEVASRA